ncbi:hypothetical protein [Virgisporangium aurantiacum]|uniref:Uncharacterized protein n=1 Tax=Virgisporangium aurantiacum TaxID=175570 RepID=A0A8J3ZG42_9ACTN|nr:hypothetical protein [Virgisporangium aurantiacum]GIJ63299.1 hypothetical protein Vau01_108150 [Virgisporangium aurantiacum]
MVAATGFYKIVNSLTSVGEVGSLPRVLQVSGDDPATAKQEITQPLRSQGGDDLMR